MPLTTNFSVVQLPGRGGNLITHVDGGIAPPHLLNTRIPPAWERVQVETDPSLPCVAIGYDTVGRKIHLYSSEHTAKAKSSKFERVRALLDEEADIRDAIETDLHEQRLSGVWHEAALIAYLIFETGIRPGSTTDTLAKVQAYGATTLQLRHVRPGDNTVRLQFVGKKGVNQNVPVRNPYLVDEFKRRKQATTAWSANLFHCSAATLRQYVAGLGSGSIHAPDDQTVGEERPWLSSSSEHGNGYPRAKPSGRPSSTQLWTG